MGKTYMSELEIIVMPLFLGTITSIFSKVPNQIITTGSIVSTKYHYISDETMPT